MNDVEKAKKINALTDEQKEAIIDDVVSKDGFLFCYKYQIEGNEYLFENILDEFYYYIILDDFYYYMKENGCAEKVVFNYWCSKEEEIMDIFIKEIDEKMPRFLTFNGLIKENCLEMYSTFEKDLREVLNCFLDRLNSI